MPAVRPQSFRACRSGPWGLWRRPFSGFRVKVRKYSLPGKSGAVFRPVRVPGPAHSRPTCLSPAASGSHPDVQSPDAAPARRGSGPMPDARRPTRHRAARPRSVPHSRSALLSVPGPQPMPGALRTNAFFAVCGRKRFILGEFGNFVTFAPNFKPKQQWHINYSKVRKA